MSISVYQKGALVRIDITFTDVDGNLIDPTGNTLSVTPPDGSTVAYVYLTDAEVVRDSLGVYHADIEVTQGGKWLYYWQSTGVGQAAQQALLMVEPSDFAVTP